MTVTDLDPAVAWYTKLLAAEPDARPMDGLVEWHLAPTFGLQVWSEADRAGRSAMIVDHSDLDELAGHLDRAGIQHGGVQDVTASRILPVTDPDGNRIVFTGPFGT
ncbi:MAG: VOC family protein [Pseudonocardia sp.]